ncbi:hypothetical protein [Lentzea flaviverrucosa]|uniref:Uncharacterized protein n=1 Tax=Lentzea flaviverrucosa TaxID=200379 RepID=A0A1H9XA34_9PSEU|nr:hypothetical protein [Lentzea flaviverrucosa]RDI21708.1 hypothetical protein DFR72_113255 [Lentzea flaviverrucosa]SES42982.1 hypothetical protein SAMN05216195_11425 [Lentzea flaviverrucosa]
MDAPTAALIGATLGFGGALFAAWLNPFSTARHAKAAKNLELRREAYASGLLAVGKLVEAGGNAEMMYRLVGEMAPPFVTMRLLCSPDVANLYFELTQTAGKIARYYEDHAEKNPDELLKQFRTDLDLFVEAARGDLGTDELYHSE